MNDKEENWCIYLKCNGQYTRKKYLKTIDGDVVIIDVQRDVEFPVINIYRPFGPEAFFTNFGK